VAVEVEFVVLSLFEFRPLLFGLFDDVLYYENGDFSMMGHPCC
jgi:hypothetical protein